MCRRLAAGGLLYDPLGAGYIAGMSIRPIVRMGHPVLARVADPVLEPTAPEIGILLDDMVETMRDAPGVGLAAPQVAVPLRIMVFEVPSEWADQEGDGAATELMEVINPTIEPLDDLVSLGWEGCLSIPGLRGEVPRWHRIRYSGVDRNGAAIERIAEGFHARVVQHEYDHLEGVLYPERMIDMRRFGYTDELLAAARALPDEGETSA